MKTYISSLLRDEEFLVCRILLFEKFRAIKLRISLWFRGEADLVIVYYNNGGANFCGQLEVNQSCRLLFCFTMGFGVRWTFSSVEFLAPLLMTSPTTARIHSQRNAYRPQTSRTTWGRARAKATLLFNNTGSRKPQFKNMQWKSYLNFQANILHYILNIRAENNCSLMFLSNLRGHWGNFN